MGTKMGINIFSKTLADTWHETPPDIIKNGFKKSGIFPFDANVIPVEKYDPNAYRRYQLIREKRLLQSQQNTSSPETLKKICIDYFNKQNNIPDETLQKQCPPDQQEETLAELKSINKYVVKEPSVILSPKSPRIFTFEEAFLKIIQQDKKNNNTVIKKTCLKRCRSDNQVYNSEK